MSRFSEKLGLAEYKIDSFSFDCDQYVDDFGFEEYAHGAYFGSVTGAPCVGPTGIEGEDE